MRLIGLLRVGGRSPAKIAARLYGARDGATAVEFGLVAMPFLALLGGCLENGLVSWEQEILQQAVVGWAADIHGQLSDYECRRNRCSNLDESVPQRDLHPA